MRVGAYTDPAFHLTLAQKRCLLRTLKGWVHMSSHGYVHKNIHGFFHKETVRTMIRQGFLTPTDWFNTYELSAAGAAKIAQMQAKTIRRFGKCTYELSAAGAAKIAQMQAKTIRRFGK